MTRQDIAVQLLAAMVSTGDGLNAIFESAAANKEDPYIFAARAAIKFVDALANEIGTDINVTTGIDKTIFGIINPDDLFKGFGNQAVSTPPKPKKPRKKRES